MSTPEAKQKESLNTLRKSEITRFTKNFKKIIEDISVA
jgi:hypothetical protein